MTPKAHMVKACYPVWGTFWQLVLLVGSRVDEEASGLWECDLNGYCGSQIFYSVLLPLQVKGSLMPQAPHYTIISLHGENWLKTKPFLCWSSWACFSFHLIYSFSSSIRVLCYSKGKLMNTEQIQRQRHSSRPGSQRIISWFSMRKLFSSLVNMDKLRDFFRKLTPESWRNHVSCKYCFCSSQA